MRGEAPALPATLWESWLWGLDATADVHAKAPLNHSHLAGLVLCRALAAQLAAHGQAALGAGAPALSAAQWGASVAGVVGGAWWVASKAGAAFLPGALRATFYGCLAGGRAGVGMA